MGMIWNATRLPEDAVAPVVQGRTQLHEVLEPQPDDVRADIDKAWHGLHFVLTGQAEPHHAPLSDALLGGQEIGEDQGYGPSLLLSTAHVRAIAVALATLSVEQVRSSVDLAAMDAAELYPGIWDDEGVVDEMLVPSFVTVRDFYAVAAAAGQVVVHGLV